ncbi:MAG: hypothetical protein R6V17_02640 [Halanaerobacter sp.]
MRVKKIKLTLVLIILIMVMISPLSNAQERKIYVGDLINLEITTDMAADKVKEKFSAVERVEFKEDAGVYQLKIRSFEPGEKVIELGDKEISLVVESTLEKYSEREEVFKGDLSVKEAEFEFNWTYLFYLIGLIVLSLIVYYLWKLWKSRSWTSKTAYQKFEELFTEAEQREDYLVALTYALKRYLEERFNCQIIGKTSAEIIEEVEDISALQEHLAALEDWLQQVDYYKYTKAEADTDGQYELAAALQEIVDEIEAEAPDDKRDYQLSIM